MRFEISQEWGLTGYFFNPEKTKVPLVERIILTISKSAMLTSKSDLENLKLQCRAEEIDFKKNFNPDIETKNPKNAYLYILFLFSESTYFKMLLYILLYLTFYT